MSLTIRFLINLEPAQYMTIVSQLQSSQFEVNSVTNLGDEIPIPSQLFCSKDFSDWPEVVTEQNNYQLKPNSTPFEYFSLTIVPPLLSLGTAVGVKKS